MVWVRVGVGYVVEYGSENGDVVVGLGVSVLYVVPPSTMYVVGGGLSILSMGWML